MQSVNENKSIVLNGEDFCYFEDVEGEIIGFVPASTASTIPNEAVAFVYVHQNEEENIFSRTYRIGKRIEKSIFDLNLDREILKDENFLIVTNACNSDYCVLNTPEKRYFYAVDDKDIVVDDKTQLDAVFSQALATQGAYNGEKQLRK